MGVNFKFSVFFTVLQNRLRSENFGLSCRKLDKAPTIIFEKELPNNMFSELSPLEILYLYDPLDFFQ